MWTTNWESGTCHDTPFSISFITNLLVLHVKTHSPDYPNMMWFTEVAARPGENQPSATSDFEAQSALALLAFASLVKFPAFQFSSKSSVLQPLFSSHRKIIFRVWVPPIPHDMSQPLCLNISFCVSVYNIFLFLFTFPNFASLSSSFEQVLICSRYSARST